VPYVNLALQHLSLERELLEAAGRVLRSGQFILGPEVQEFERQFAVLCGTKYAIGVDNGTSALILCLRGLGIGPGDEVITATNSFVASTSSIALCGATPVFVDNDGTYNMDPVLIASAITPKTKAIVAVHWTGNPADMRAIRSIADAKNIPVIEDAAQAVCGKLHGAPVGSLGRAACFSLHPLKNLSACGDGGVITTDDEKLYQYLLLARNHGLSDRDHCDFWSFNCRLDTLHAAMLLVKLQHLQRWTEARRAHAAYYRKHLAGLVDLPQETPGAYAVYHTFIIQTDRRDALRAFLKERGVETAVHYPIPIHLQKAAKGLGKPKSLPVAERHADRVLSLPIYPELSEEQRACVAENIREFFKS
jgi:dTDP-4-amino-4,6-dideoxygalactose transaminase